VAGLQTLPVWPIDIVSLHLSWKATAACLLSVWLLVVVIAGIFSIYSPRWAEVILVKTHAFRNTMWLLWLPLRNILLVIVLLYAPTEPFYCSVAAMFIVIASALVVVQLQPAGNAIINTGLNILELLLCGHTFLGLVFRMQLFLSGSPFPVLLASLVLWSLTFVVLITVLLSLVIHSRSVSKHMLLN